MPSDPEESNSSNVYRSSFTGSSGIGRCATTMSDPLGSDLTIGSGSSGSGGVTHIALPLVKGGTWGISMSPALHAGTGSSAWVHRLSKLRDNPMDDGVDIGDVDIVKACKSHHFKGHTSLSLSSSWCLPVFCCLRRL
jgi:hypothetical protein